MNFQTSKRIMCCLMAALILCCAVVRPIEASATGLGAVAVGKVVGFALKPAISSILVALGVTGTVAAFTELVENISKNVPSEYIITALDGTEYLSAINYNDITYVSQVLVEWVQSCLFNGTGTQAPSYVPRFGYDGVYKTLYNAATEQPWYNSLVGDHIYEFTHLTCICFNSGLKYLIYSDSHASFSIGSSSFTIHGPHAYIMGYQSGYNGGYDPAAPTTTVYGASSSDTILSGISTYRSFEVAAGLSHTDVFHTTVPDYETWVYPGIHIIILPEDPPEEPEETEPPETEPPESQPAVPPLPSEPDPDTPSEPDPDVTEPEVTEPAELPDIDPSIPSEPETPEEDNPVENPNKYETYIPITFPNKVLDPNEVTQPEIQTGNGSTTPEIETGNDVEIRDPNRTETDEPTNPDGDTEWGDPVIWPDFPSVDTPEVPFPGYDNDYTGEEQDTSWLTKIGEWIKWLGELIKEWIKWLGEYIVEWLKWLGEIIQLLPQAIAYYLKLMVQWLVEAFKPLFQKLAEWLQPLMDYLLEGLKTLFIPREGYFDSKIEGLKAKFPFFNSIVGTVPAFKSFILSLGAKPPVIYIDLPSATGSWYWGPRTIFLDLRWYAQYKPTMDVIISGFLWLWFIWRMILALPGIIQGTQGFWNRPQTTEEKGLVVASNWYDRR